MTLLSESTSRVEAVASFTSLTRQLAGILVRRMSHTLEILNQSGKVMVLLHNTN